MTWRRGEAGSTLIDRPKDAPVPDFTNGKERYKASSVRPGIELEAKRLPSSYVIDLLQFTCSVSVWVINRGSGAVGGWPGNRR